MTWSATLGSLQRAALASVHGGRAVERALAAEPLLGPVRLLACGKAAGAMAEGALQALGAQVRAARVTIPMGAPEPHLPWLAFRASHPLPDAGSQRAGEQALACARARAPHETLLVLLSGGASALWCVPAPGLSLADKRATTEALLQSGAEIDEINTVRKQLSALKGGRLRAAAGTGAVLTLAVSDVRADAPETIGSGPTVEEPSRFQEALAVLERRALLEHAPRAVRAHLEAGAARERAEPPGPPVARGTASFRVIASLTRALAAGERCARERDLRVENAGPCLYGEARDIAGPLVERCRAARAQGAEIVLAGGEPTVTVRGPGKGGRAQELALAFALALERGGERDWVALFAGSDGRDGPTDVAGAFADGALPARARALGLDPELALARNDAYPLLRASGAHFVCEPTHTNVTDLAWIALCPERGRME